MGLINKIKKMFKKSIDLEDKNQNSLLYLEKNKAKIKFGTSLIVKPNFVAILVAKNKVADIFTEGSYRLDTNNMPLLSRLLKLTKPNRKGVLPKTFCVDIYYLNLQEFYNLKFKSYDFAVIKSKQYKAVKVKVSGNFDFKISSPVDFMEVLLLEHGAINESIAKNEVAYLVSKLAVRKIQKNKPQVEELYERVTDCFVGLIDYINQELLDCGIKLTRIEITDTIFPKKIYKNVSLSYNENYKNNNVEQIECVENKTQPLDYINSAQQIQVNSLSTENNDNIAESGENKTMCDLEVKTETIVQLQEQSKTIEYKQCNNCGAYNPKDANSCFNCKSKFKD